MDSDWCHRAKLARDILHLAHNLTYSQDRLSVYLTDVSLDNLVVSEEGVVKIVDLEHTIVVDRHPSSTGNENKNILDFFFLGQKLSQDDNISFKKKKKNSG